MVFLFRTKDGEDNAFDGRTNWKQGSSDLIWSENRNLTRTTWTAIFGHCDADFDTDNEATINLDEWASTEHRVQQWTSMKMQGTFTNALCD